KERPFAGRHAIVTGGGRGIGAAIAASLAARGAAVSLLGRTASTLESTSRRLADEHGATVGFAVADIGDEASITTAIRRCLDERGSAAILVNNAGIAPSAPFLKSDAKLWRDVLDVDLMGAVHAVRAVLPGMLETGSG